MAVQRVDIMTAKTRRQPNKACKPVFVIDNEDYIKLNEPKSKEGFNNESKNINETNTSHSHSVVDHYRYNA